MIAHAKIQNLIRPATSTNGVAQGVHPYHFVDLFAGCGGLSLGLEQAGFKPLLFSEINPQAAETYMANRIGENIVPIGDIYQLTDSNLRMFKTFWSLNGVRDVDLVCGGPPCQGFSGIGHRRTFKLAKKEIPSNHLFLEMVRVITCIRPKIFVFENVRGLLNSKWTPNGIGGEIFKAVLKAFYGIPDYSIRWSLLHAKDYGVPQNRPRVIMVGIRSDIAGESFGRISFDQLLQSSSAVEHGFLPKGDEQPPSLVELFSDLEDPNYQKKRSTDFYLNNPQSDFQILLRTRRDGSILKKGDQLEEQEYSDHAPYIREKFQHMIRNNGEIPKKFQTKKFAQRVFPKKWGPDGPSITATSLPEDYVHYSQPRSPTVREWARLQTFPDWYQFKGPRTTGGRRRAGDPSAGIWDRDVPRYTQIGNAVPVLLAKKIGIHLASILQGVGDSGKK
ncbi:MAG: DNA (cytosine-5-)-methyltransferase [Proteobacteria bacterium]|nr:DNA (cytosine-5-)-methyltransferase [Pseudomonadota bacterium]NDD03584.1 DNA (cytosine-5-)-methyltransferase [Pseudomonadota bacterium]NDG26051.1 DNA (cytosine-5-)-methyltransferase [Pseudomonadota bacterium]